MTDNMIDDAEPVVIRICEICGQERILDRTAPEGEDSARCGCGVTPLNALDLDALSDRGP